MDININSISTNNIFLFLNKKKSNYVWLHSYGSDNLGDIDISISKEEFSKVEDLIREFCIEEKFRFLQILHHEYCAKYFVLGRINEKCIEYLIPDICSDYVRNGRILLSAEDLLKNKIFNGRRGKDKYNYE